MGFNSGLKGLKYSRRFARAWTKKHNRDKMLNVFIDKTASSVPVWRKPNFNFCFVLYSVKAEKTNFWISILDYNRKFQFTLWLLDYDTVQMLEFCKNVLSPSSLSKRLWFVYKTLIPIYQTPRCHNPQNIWILTKNTNPNPCSLLHTGYYLYNPL